MRSILSGVVRGSLSGTTGSNIYNPLRFHAFEDDVTGTFVADVLIGIGNVTEANTSTRYYKGVTDWVEYASTVPGQFYDGTKWWVVGQKACTNEITQSFDLADAAWLETGTSVAALDAVGLRGDVNGATTLTDDDGGAFEQVTELLAIPDDSNTTVWRFFVGKDTDETRFPEFQCVLNGGTAQQLLIGLNTKTGATANRTSIGTTASEVNQFGDWWELLVSVVNNNTGNNIGKTEVLPALGTTIAVAAAAATGSIIVGNVELHLNTTIEAVRGSSPLFTSGSTGSVNASDKSFDDSNIPAQGGVFLEWQPQYATSEVSGDIEILSLNDAAGLLYYDATNSLLKSFDGTNTASVALTIVAGTTYKIWAAFGGTSLQVGVDASTGTLGTFDGVFTAGTKLELVTPSANTNYTRNIRAYRQQFTEVVATLQALAA